MLVRGDDLLIGQPAHAWVSGQLARAWGNERFPAPAPREPVCLAAEQHDVGWADADLAPLHGPDGRPLSFAQYPREAHVDLWRDAPRRMLAQSRYAALLVSLHGTSLYDRWVDPDSYPLEVAARIRAYLDGERALQAELAEGLDPDEVDRNRRLVRTLDGFSLALCHERAATLEDVPATGGATTVSVRPGGTPQAEDRPVRDGHAVPPATPTLRCAVDPWPFTAERVVVGCEARRLGGSLADPPWVPLRWELSPG